MKMKTTGITVATVLLAGALVIAPFKRAKAQVAADTLAKPKTGLVKPYPVLSGFSMLPNPAARFRLGTFVYPFADFAPGAEPAYGLQANIISGSTGVTATAIGNSITAALLQKVGPVVLAAELSSGTIKPVLAIVYTIRHDGKVLISAGLMRSIANGLWAMSGEGRFALKGNGS